MTTDTEALRAQFEWSFAETGYDLTRCEICPNEYADGGTNDLWLGYQSGHAAAKAETAAAGAPMAMVQCHGSAEHPLYTADQLAAAVAAERISALCDTLLNRPARNAGLESEYAAEAAAKAADVGEPVAFAHFAENGKIRLWLWAPERPRDLDGKAAQPLYTADQLAAAVAAERERCLRIVESVDNYSNPMTANDCAAAIRAGAKESSDG